MTLGALDAPCARHLTVRTPPRRAALDLRNDVTYSIPTANLAALNSNIQSGSGTAGSVSGARRCARAVRPHPL